MSLTSRIKLDWLWLKLSFPFRFAHHPLCNPYKTQRFEILGIHLCQGCTLIVMGWITFAILGSQLVSPLNTLTLLPALLIGLAFAIPTAFADGMKLSRKYKRIARFFIGAGIGYTTSLLLFHSVQWIKILGVISTATIFLAYKQFRVIFPSSDLCVTCPDLKKKPVCPGFTIQFAANKKYEEKALVIHEQAIISRVEEITGEKIDGSSEKEGSDDFEIVYV